MVDRLTLTELEENMTRDQLEQFIADVDQLIQDANAFLHGDIGEGTLQMSVTHLEDDLREALL